MIPSAHPNPTAPAPRRRVPGRPPTTGAASLLTGLFIAAFLPAASAGVFPEVNALAPIPAPFRSPERVAVGIDAQVLVTDPLTGRLAVFDAYGRQLRSMNSFGRPLGIAVDSAGRIYVGDAVPGSVRVFAADDTELPPLGQGAGEFRLPGHIAVVEQEGLPTVYVSDGLAHEIRAYRNNGLVGRYGRHGSGLDEFLFPAGICLGGDGLLYVVDQGNDRMQVLDLDGRFVRRFPLRPDPLSTTRSGRAQGVAADGQGRLYVADTFQGCIKVFDLDGTFLGFIGRESMTAGALRSPAGLAVDPFGRLWVANVQGGTVDAFGLDCFLAPTITPPAQSVAAGSAVEFRVDTACGEGAAFQWYRDAVALVDGPGVSGSTNAALVLSDVTLDLVGMYSAAVQTAAGTVYTPGARLSVATSPYIYSAPRPRTVAQDGTTEFLVGVQGDPLYFQWLFYGVPIRNATSPTLRLTNVQPAAAGLYSVQVSNVAGTVTSAQTTLTVLLKPAITEPPRDLILAAGSTAVFNVSAIGEAPLAYQWFKGVEPISGATTTQLSIPVVSESNNGTYSVRVSNPIGAVSVSARLAVDGPAALTLRSDPDGSLVLDWNNPFFLLETATHLDGPWLSITDASPWRVTPPAQATNPAAYFRLRRP